WSNISDLRVKQNIKQNVPGLAFINKLKPVTYNLNLDAIGKLIPINRKDVTGKAVLSTTEELNAKKEKGQILYSGFVAQDVEKAAKQIGYDFSGVDAPKNDKDLYGLRYAEFVVPLVKAVQELSAKNDALEQRVEKLEAFINAQSSSVNNAQQTISLTSAGLNQNIPNPFNSSTTINYTLPKQYSAAKMMIADNTGKVLKEINLSGNSVGSIQLDASNLAASAYTYSLIVDGKLIASKQMIVAK
ncbi:MAG: tail fiber domain-containing protein, partial [Parafilimonas sp.]